MKKLKIGDYAVHYTHGLGIVHSIETREFTPGKKQVFYVLEIQDNGVPKKVFVLTDKASERLRLPIKSTEIEIIVGTSTL